MDGARGLVLASFGTIVVLAQWTQLGAGEARVAHVPLYLCATELISPRALVSMTYCTALTVKLGTFGVPLL